MSSCLKPYESDPRCIEVVRVGLRTGYKMVQKPVSFPRLYKPTRIQKTTLENSGQSTGGNMIEECTAARHVGQGPIRRPSQVFEDGCLAADGHHDAPARRVLSGRAGDERVYPPYRWNAQLRCEGWRSSHPRLFPQAKVRRARLLGERWRTH
ncbi:hypothetical protein FOVG_01372 [Fusarium oxysporum f. sp. pisi HDV247]|nr:hypothetical protein FOVG_01372 [Fusarium oxysporum f. sp. pisi HDV247]